MAKQNTDPFNIQLNENNTELVKSFLRDRITSFPRSEIRKLLEDLDKYYHMQSRRELDANGKPIEAFNSRYEDLDIGIVNPTAETDAAFYADLYLTSSPIFSAVTKKDKVDIGKAVEAKIGKDSNEFNWVGELTKVFRNLAKHNKALCELTWKKDLSFKQYAGLTDQGSLDRETVVYAGNSLKNWSLYNSFWDTTVPLSELAKEGEFAGTVSLMSYIRLAELSVELGFNVPPEIWNSATSSSAWDNGKYVWPEVFTGETEDPKDRIDWLAFAGQGSPTDSKSKFKDAKRLYEVHKFYVRTIPSMLGIKVPNEDMPQIFRFITVNGYVVQIYHVTDFHNMLPVFGAQVLEDDVELLTQGPAQIATRFQELMKQLLDRQLAIMDRLVSDRGLYDPQKVDSESISSPVPDAKIPVRPSAREGLAGAYMPIPFNPNGFFELSNLLTQIKAISDESTGINQAQKGQFVKGNKTLGEWNEVMDGATQKPYLRAMVLESSFFAPLKKALKSNILQYQKESTEIYSPAENDVVTFDPAEVRANVVDIRLTDGMKSASKLLKTGGLEYMLQMLLQFPQIGHRYDVAGVFSHLIMQGRGVDIRDYSLTPEQQAQAIAATNQNLLQTPPTSSGE